MVLAIESNEDIDKIIAALQKHKSPEPQPTLSESEEIVLRLITNGISDKELRSKKIANLSLILEKLRNKYLMIADKNGKRYILK